MSRCLRVFSLSLSLSLSLFFARVAWPLAVGEGRRGAGGSVEKVTVKVDEVGGEGTRGKPLEMPKSNWTPELETGHVGHARTWNNGDWKIMVNWHAEPPRVASIWKEPPRRSFFEMKKTYFVSTSNTLIVSIESIEQNKSLTLTSQPQQ